MRSKASQYSEIYDVVILGAGAAGLAAANEIQKNKKKFLILDGHNYVGGRVDTHSQHEELGAEFIHGAVPSFYKKLKGVRFERVPDFHLIAKVTQAKTTFFRDPKYFDRLAKLLKRPPASKKYVPFLHYFRRYCHSSQSEEKIIRAYVEGFMAADPNSVAVQTVYDAIHSEDASRSYWPSIGYRALLQKLYLDRLSKFVRYDCAIRKIKWTKRFVILTDSKGHIYQAKKVLITASMGVLKSNQIKFEPSIPLLRSALALVRMGQIVKVDYTLKKASWAKWLAENLPHGKKFSFIHVFDSPICVYWLKIEARSIKLTAWVGHGAAKKMKMFSKSEASQVVDRESQRIFGMSQKNWNASVLRSSVHQWGRDPFVRGAYAFFLPHADEKLKKLFHRSPKESVHFAGEAFAEKRAGTVDGAIRSGIEAARRLV